MAKEKVFSLGQEVPMGISELYFDERPRSSRSIEKEVSSDPFLGSFYTLSKCRECRKSFRALNHFFKCEEHEGRSPLNR